MADSTIDSELFYLDDRWPGKPCPSFGTPADGFTGASHHNVAAPVFPVGTKVQVFNTGVTAGKAGWASFIYLKLEMQDATNVLAARMFVAQHTDAAAGSFFDATNEIASVNGDGLGPIAVGLSAMTVDYYGWFWCDGVCPEEFVAALGGNYYTLGTVAIGDMGWGTLATPGTTAGEIGLETPGAAPAAVIGVASHADA